MNAIRVVLGLIISTSVLAPSGALAAAKQPVVLDQKRLAHVRELLGNVYGRSVVRLAEKIGDVQKVLYREVADRLQGDWKKQSDGIARAITSESKRHGFDPIFLYAVIENESSFNPLVRGTSGEIGLMQITPETAKWVSKRYGIAYRGPSSLKDPVTNIRIGAAYLAHLRKVFDSHSRLYLAAYNMGAKNVDRALAKQIWPKTYASKVMERYVRIYRGIATGTQASGS